MTSPSDRMILTVFAGIAESVRDLIRSRIEEGRQVALRRRVPFGRCRSHGPGDRISSSTRKLTGCLAIGAFTSAFSQKSAGKSTDFAFGRGGPIPPRPFIALSSSRDAISISLMFLRPSFPCRYEPDAIVPSGVGDAVNLSIDHTGGDFPNFPIVLSVIDLRERNPLEDRSGVREIGAMFRQVRLALFSSRSNSTDPRLRPQAPIGLVSRLVASLSRFSTPFVSESCSCVPPAG